MDATLTAAIEAGRLPGIHIAIISKSERTEVEQYHSGLDERWGDSLGSVDFGPNTLHDIRSVTKSIVSLLYGIALDRSLVPGLGVPLMDSFPEYADLAKDPARAALTIEHALTMTLGLKWDESGPYTSLENDEIGMEFAPDRYRFVLEKPVVTEPGTVWAYSGGCVALVGAVIARGTGKSLPEFAREALFEPLGISDFEWIKGADGVPSAASGLRLKAPDLLRIGLMCLRKGEWEGRQVISSSWIEGSLKPSVPIGDGMGYGRLWWVGYAPDTSPEEAMNWVSAFGNGGQRLQLMASTETVMVTLCGNYNKPDAHLIPRTIWREVVLGLPASS
ncbi:beta-lactamase/transpeptidase-like protein [Thozetella sp. PMI_491]|nr:beta-lactamase/transpeptidase-like protein [Thozetella sp. PMI_491]